MLRCCLVLEDLGQLERFGRADAFNELLTEPSPAPHLGTAGVDRLAGPLLDGLDQAVDTFCQQGSIYGCLHSTCLRIGHAVELQDFSIGSSDMKRCPEHPRGHAAVFELDDVAGQCFVLHPQLKLLVMEGERPTRRCSKKASCAR